MLENAHDKHVHEEIHRTYDLLKRSVFIFKMKKLVSEYVLICSICQLFKSSRQLFYEKFHSIDLLKKFLTKINIDFIIVFSKIVNNFNTLLTMIDRFSKFVFL